MIRISLKKHLKNHNKILIKNAAWDSSDMWSLILTESFFRPTKILILEYIAYRILKATNFKRANKISLGRAQIQARHWTKQITLKNILSYETAYCEIYLNFKNNNLLNVPLSKKIAHHVGETRTYYLRVATAAQKHINALRY